MSDGELIAACVIGLIVIWLTIKFLKFVVGVILIGALIVVALCVSGEVECPIDCGPSIPPGGTNSEGVGPPILQTESEAVYGMDGRHVGTDPATGNQRWDSVPTVKVSGSVRNVGTGTARNTTVRIGFCGDRGMVLYREDVALGDLAPGQSLTFERNRPRDPQYRSTKVNAFSAEVAPQMTQCP